MNCHSLKPSKAALCCPWFLLVSIFGLVSCQHGAHTPNGGLYEAVFQTDPVTTILVERQTNGWVVRNGEERIQLTSEGGGEVYSIPVFGGTWSGGWSEGVWVGVWTDSLRTGNYQIPLTIHPIEITSQPNSSATAKSAWKTTEGLLLLSTRVDSVWATISTPTGDYRFLNGKIQDNRLVFSTFDGSHLFRFSADIQGDSLVDGEFISGNHYRTAFSGVRLASPDVPLESGQLSPNEMPIQFKGVSTRGDTAQWNEERLMKEQKTGLVVDIMGTWCPNCMDEARLLKSLAPEYPELQFVSLAFERNTDERSLKRLADFHNELGLTWEVLLGGKASKSVAADVFGGIDTVRSFPTTVFWAPGEEPVIHSGFHGPATGEGYAVEQRFFKTQLDRISGRSENR